ncbi:MAG: hypothetical protein GY851_29580 [bacterium]|nr:hypothetical protein [bacterium]
MACIWIPVALAAIVAGAAGDAIEVGREKHLFLDDFLIASMDNVSRTIHPAVKSGENPVLWPEEPWEGTVAVLYGSVIRDGDRYRMWYHGGGGVSYAESADGVVWEKPRLDFVVEDGQRTNAVVKRGAEEGAPNAIKDFYEVFGVHRDAVADEAKRYVMGFLSIQRGYDGPRQDPFHRGQRRGLGVAYSPDGLRWTLADSWTTEAICDGGTYWMRDPRRDVYILFGRTKYVTPEVAAAWKGDAWVDSKFWGRSVARTESPDFQDWDFKDPATAPIAMTVDVKDVPGDEIYSMAVFPYETVYIGLVQMFHNQEDACHLDIQLAVSHDGAHFERVGDRTPFLPCGGIGEWDRFNTSMANNPPIAVDDDLRFYYGGRTYRHSPYAGPDKGEPGGGIGFATVARDRFVSLDARFSGGVVTTKPVRLDGDAIHLNGASAFGSIVVEVLNSAGEAVAVSEPARADALDIPVVWAEGGTEGLTQPVSLRFTLKNARLYAVWCE